MNIQDYISSGILECYVLGQLSRTEAAKVEEMAAQYPEVLKEISAIEESIELYAAAHARIPDASVKEKLMQTLSFAGKETAYEAKVIEIYKSSKAVIYYAVASTVFALLFGMASLYYYQEWNLAKSEITALRQDNEKIARYNNLVNRRLNQQLSTKEKLLVMLQDTNTKSVQLKGLPLSPASMAVVFWNTQEHSVFIDVKNLPIPPDDKQYQLWALQDGVPVDAGVFNTDTTLQLQKMKNISAAQAFAVTLENKGGNSTPTLDQMYVLGNTGNL